MTDFLPLINLKPTTPDSLRLHTDVLGIGIEKEKDEEEEKADEEGRMWRWRNTRTS
jgi:hypothetical protein